MSNHFDQHGINHATVAILREMKRDGPKPDTDVIFFGCTELADADRTSLGEFAMQKNYNLIMVSFDPAQAAAGPIGLEAVLTDGETNSICLKGGRLWKRDRRSPAALLFAESGAVVKISRKGRLVLREMKGQYHDQGFDFAREAMAARAAAKPGHVPVVSQIGGVTTVADVRMLAAAFEAA